MEMFGGVWCTFLLPLGFCHQVFEGIHLNFLLLDWDLTLSSNLIVGEIILMWKLPPVDSIKLHFDICSFSDLGWLGLEEWLEIGAFSKPIEEFLSLKTEILALLEGAHCPRLWISPIFRLREIRCWRLLQLSNIITVVICSCKRYKVVIYSCISCTAVCTVVYKCS